jgi:hypothetical protein
MPPRPIPHPFEDWYSQHRRDTESPIARDKAVTVWNTLLVGAIDHLWAEKDQFVRDGEYESARVALELQESLERLKCSAKGR